MHHFEECMYTYCKMDKRMNVTRTVPIFIGSWTKPLFSFYLDPNHFFLVIWIQIERKKWSGSRARPLLFPLVQLLWTFSSYHFYRLICSHHLYLGSLHWVTINTLKVRQGITNRLTYCGGLSVPTWSMSIIESSFRLSEVTGDTRISLSDINMILIPTDFGTGTLTTL